MDDRGRPQRSLEGVAAEKEQEEALIGPRKKIGSIEALALQKVQEKPEPVTLALLVAELAKELGYSKERVASRLMQLEASGKIKIVEKRTFNTFPSYAFSPEALWFWVALGAALLSFGLTYVTSGAVLYLRYLFGGLLVLFLPGYSLIQFIYTPKGIGHSIKKKSELDDLERIALSIGLSLALVPLVGLALNFTPLGIRLLPIVASLTILTAVLLVFGLKKKHSYYKIAKDVF